PVRINMEGANGLDTYLRVFDATGAAVAEDDDGGEAPLSSSLSLVLPPGEYFVGASAFPNFNYDPNVPGLGDPSDAGDYTLSVSVDVFDPNGTRAAGVPLRLNSELRFASVDEDLGFDSRVGATKLDAPAKVVGSDVDFFTFVAPDDGLLDIDVLGRSGADPDPGLGTFAR